jgi:hypothetical protein
MTVGAALIRHDAATLLGERMAIRMGRFINRLKYMHMCHEVNVYNHIMRLCIIVRARLRANVKVFARKRALTGRVATYSCC